MRKFNLLILMLFVLFNFNYSYAQCPNGNLEMGNFTNWDLYLGNNTGSINPGQPINLSLFTPGTAINRHAIETPGVDPNVNIPKVLYGNNSMRLGDLAIGGNSEIAAYTFSADKAKGFTFSSAVVLEDGFHLPAENPHFKWWISKSKNLANSRNPGNLIIDGDDLIADLTNPFFATSNGFAFKDWEQTCVDLNLECIKNGEMLTVYFLVSDCAFTVHKGYAYIDALCEDVVKPIFTISNNKICDLKNFIADGSATQNETSFFWGFCEVDMSSGAPVVVPGTCENSSIVDGPVGTFNFGNLIGDAESGKWFKLSLHAANCKGQFVEYFQYVQIVKPKLTVSNVFYCCGDQIPTLNAFAFWANPTKYYGKTGTFSWYNEAGTLLGNGVNSPIYKAPQILGESNAFSLTGFTGSGKFRVVYKDPNGCTAEAWFYIINVGNVTMQLINEECWSQADYTVCGLRKIKAEISIASCPGDKWLKFNVAKWMELSQEWVKNNVTFSWNTGATTQIIEMKPGVTTYSCTASWYCGGVKMSLTESKKVNFNEFTGALPHFDGGNFETPSTTIGQLWGSTACTPNNDGTNDCIVFYHTGTANGTPRQYNAFQYKIEIFDRWGNLRETVIKKQPCEGFYQGEVRFCPDGSKYDVGTYYYVLYLRNCDKSDWVRVANHDFTIVK